MIAEKTTKPSQFLDDWCDLTQHHFNILLESQTLSDVTSLRKSGIILPDTLQQRLPKEKSIKGDQEVIGFTMTILRNPNLLASLALIKTMDARGYRALLLYDLIRWIEHFKDYLDPKCCYASLDLVSGTNCDVFMYDPKQEKVTTTDADILLIRPPKGFKRAVTLWVKKD